MEKPRKNIAVDVETQAWRDEEEYFDEPAEAQVEDMVLGDPMEDDSLPPTPSPVRPRKTEPMILSPPPGMFHDNSDIYGSFESVPIPRMKPLMPSQDTTRRPAVLGIHTQARSKITKQRSQSTSPLKSALSTSPAKRDANHRSNSKA